MRRGEREGFGRGDGIDVIGRQRAFFTQISQISQMSYCEICVKKYYNLFAILKTPSLGFNDPAPKLISMPNFFPLSFK